MLEKWKWGLCRTREGIREELEEERRCRGQGMRRAREDSAHERAGHVKLDAERPQRAAARRQGVVQAECVFSCLVRRLSGFKT